MLFHRTTVRLAALLLSASMLGLSASADGGDLPTAAFGDGLKGACVTSTPRTGAVCLGQRIIRPGDVLTAEQLAQLTYSHPGSETDRVSAPGRRGSGRRGRAGLFHPGPKKRGPEGRGFRHRDL